MPAPVTQARAAPDSSTFTLTSPDLPTDGSLPVEYTCDGDGSTLALTWSGAPAGTAGYAVIMHHIAAPDDIHWYWVLYNLPADVTSLAKNVSGVGILGNNANNSLVEYSPPCSKGPGDKEYIYTVYALSAQPQITDPPEQVDRAALLDAIQDITLASAELHVIYARAGMTGMSDQQGRPGGIPPAEAIVACNGKAAQDACSFTSPKGEETGVCETVQSQLACSTQRGPKDGDHGQRNSQQGNNRSAAGATTYNYLPLVFAAGASAYNIEQAISDKAQGMTISFDALAFLTGDLGADSFFPPGKVADFWGFQYLRDNDPSRMGHNTDFLTRAALNMLYALTPAQRGELIALAESQVDDINQYAYNRFVLMDAFRRLLEGDLPPGCTGLDAPAVQSYSAELYHLDGEISYARAQVMGTMINAFTADQKAYLDAMVGRGMLEWPVVSEPPELRGLSRDVKVAVMTYAGDMFSWYAGSVEADVYFCPERHGTYFGSFYMKDAPAVGNPGYSIPVTLTAELGADFLATLTLQQSSIITGLVDLQKPSLYEIVDLREDVAALLRQFKTGSVPNQAAVLSLMDRYGELDGEIVYLYATAFAQVDQMLTAEQQAALTTLRTDLLGDLSYPSGAFLYSQAIPMPEIPETDFLFK
jgi:phosphatidylethanolamine-binding protein (PEBP) family uncharacterized protein